MVQSILVTGATGNLGRDVVDALRAEGFRVKRALRRPQDAATDVAFDYDDPQTYEPAVAAAECLFLMAPPLDPESDRKLNEILTRARQRGAPFVVLNTAFGVDLAEDAPLRRVEHFLKESRLPHAIIRPNWFMENFSTGPIRDGIRDQNAIFLAAGSGRISFISTRDIAAAVARLFADKREGDFNLTGMDSLDHDQVAATLSRVTGREIRYHDIPEQDMIGAVRRMGLPQPQSQYLKNLYQFVRDGYCAGIAPGFKEITGRDPIPFEQFAQEHAQDWQPEKRA